MRSVANFYAFLRHAHITLQPNLFGELTAHGDGVSPVLQQEVTKRQAALLRLMEQDDEER